MKEREYRFDNLKLLLIVLVIFGHILEFVPNSMDKYIFIYTFHMPCFMFVTGYFAKFDRWNIILKLVYPYFLFQTLYNYFETKELLNANYQHTYIVPYWIMWYLLTIIIYYIMLPLFDDEKFVNRIVLFAGAFICAIIFAKDVYIGYIFSLARTLHFLPFFLAGFYIKDTKLYDWLNDIPWFFKVLYLILVKLLTDIVLGKNIITHMMLFGSTNYQTAGYSPKIKIIIYAMAFAWIIGLVFIMPNIKIPFVTMFGRGTLSVFLLHGFIIKLIQREVYQNGLVISQRKAFGIAVLLVVILGNPLVSKVFNFICTGDWIKKTAAFIKSKFMLKNGKNYEDIV